MAYNPSKDLSLTTCTVYNSIRIPIAKSIVGLPIQLSGSMIYNIADEKVYFSNGMSWFPTDGTAVPTTLSSVGAGYSLVNNGLGPALAIKSLSVSGAGMSILSSATELIIQNTSPSSDITITDAGTGIHESLLSSTTNPNFSTKGLVAGPNLSLTSTATDITIDAIIPAPVPVTLMSAGGFYSLAGLGVYPNLTVKGLNPGTGITLANTGTGSVTISASNSVVPTLTSVGGMPLVVNGTGPALTIKGLLGDYGMIDLIPTDTTIQVTLTGGPVSLSDIGVVDGHMSVAGPSVGNSLRTKGLVAGAGVTLTETVTDITIEITSSETLTLTAGPGIAIGGTQMNPIIINLNPDPVTLSTLTVSGFSLVGNGTGPALTMKGIIPGAGINIADGGTDLVITNTNVSATITLTNAGVAAGNQTLISDGANPAFKLKALNAGTGIAITSNTTDITISGTVNNITSAGGTSLVFSSANNVLKGLSAGGSLSIVDNGTFLTITDGGSSGNIGFFAYFTADAAIAANSPITGSWAAGSFGGWNSGAFNTTTGEFTAPSAGIYTVSFQVSNNSTSNITSLFLNSGLRYSAGNNQAPDYAESMQSGSMSMSLSAGNILYLGMRNAATVRALAANLAGAAGGTWFSVLRH